MFLAWKELRHAKGKFGLIVALVALVSYLVYFLTSLAYGLASSYTNGVTAWQADQIVMTDASNGNVMMSVLTQDDFDNLSLTGEKAKLGLFPAVISKLDAPADVDTKIEIYVFGVDNGSFIAPETSLADNEAIVDSSLQDLGYGLGDTLVVAGTDYEWVIVGFTDKTTYQTAPIVFTNLETWMEYRFRATIPVSLFSAVVVRGSAVSDDANIVIYTIDEFINNLPGYSAQVATFSIMIGFLIIIVAFVLGIFIYVLTIQKTAMFGVMKAQGISNGYIGGSVVYQTLIITGFGIFIGLALTIVSGIFLGGFVPFAINPLFYGLITVAFFVFSILGGLFSVKAVLKIDPRIAIG